MIVFRSYSKLKKYIYKIEKLSFTVCCHGNDRWFVIKVIKVVYKWVSKLLVLIYHFVFDIYRSFKRKGCLFRSYYIHTGIPIKTWSDDSFKQSVNLKLHQGIDTVARPLKCDHCETSFTYSSFMKQHQCIDTAVRPYKCGDYDSSFIRDHLKQHHLSHTIIRTWAL